MPTYKDAGVDVEQANQFVSYIQKKFPQIGGFSGLYPINDKQTLVASTDGVGTKLKIAFDLNVHSTIGIDLVAMCVNDVITTGAKPLFFLDYFACSKLNTKRAKQILNGIAKGCEIAKCSLLGGETAEMPGFYRNEEYDLAGFCVGIVESNSVIDGSKISDGDVIIGLASNGVHSNGFSLVRKIIEDEKIKLDERFEATTLGSTLLIPTKIYVDDVTQALSEYEVKAMAHITGGGLEENILRVVPSSYGIELSYKWSVPSIFNWIQESARVEMSEMYKTFNMGIGYVLIVSQEVFQTIKDPKYIKIGRVVSRKL